MLLNAMSAFMGADDNREVGKYLPSVEYEEKIMEFVDMKVGVDYKIYDVDLPQSKGHIHTLEAGFNNKEVLVLVHGYAAAAVFYFKVIKELKDHFHIYSIDLFGLGSSARPKMSKFEVDDVLSFFIDPLEEWRKVLNLTNFVLMGHSMGGYICAHYLMMKRPPLKMLYLLSPAGFTKRSEEEMEEELKDWNSGRSFFEKLKGYVFNLVELKKVSPFDFLIFGRMNSLKRYFSGGRLRLTEREAEVFTEYFASTLEKRLSGEKVLGVLLHFARYSRKPIIDALVEMDQAGQLTIPVKVMYGVADWMDSQHTEHMNKHVGLHLDIVYIQNADHQIIYQNPEGLAKILKDDKKRGYENISKEFNSSRKK